MPRYASKRLIDSIQHETEENAYGDLAIYIPPSSGSTNLDKAGQPAPRVDGPEVPCNFTDAIRNRQSLESWIQEADLSKVDAEIRFAESSVTPDKGGQFRLIQKWDDPMFLPSTYDIVGIRYRGALGYMCALSKVKI